MNRIMHQRLITNSVIVIIFLTTIVLMLKSAHGNDHSDEATKTISAIVEANECDTVKCANIEICPIGMYLQWATRLDGDCCNTCKPYAKLGEKCGIITGSIFCIPNLVCAYENNGTTCAYSWETNYLTTMCDKTYCPTYKSCPKNTFLISNDTNFTTCCEQCVPYSNYGEYCNDQLPCVSGLNCKDNICSDSDNCLEEKTKCDSITSCPTNTYFLPADGVQRCCDACLKYVAVGESCNDTIVCGSELICDPDSHKCIENKLNCALIQCSPPKCDDGVIVSSNGETSCCPFCRSYSNYGEFCNDNYPCNPKFACKNSICDFKENCHCD